MPAIAFDRDAMATWYATEHSKVDPGLRTIHYLATNAPDREIRLLEVNTMIVERTDESLKPFDFGVDFGSEGEHKLLVLDVTPGQWERIERGALALPPGWSLRDAVIEFSSSASLGGLKWMRPTAYLVAKS